MPVWGLAALDPSHPRLGHKLTYYPAGRASHGNGDCVVYGRPLPTTVRSVSRGRKSWDWKSCRCEIATQLRRSFAWFGRHRQAVSQDCQTLRLVAVIEQVERPIVQRGQQILPGIGAGRIESQRHLIRGDGLSEGVATQQIDRAVVIDDGDERGLG